MANYKLTKKRNVLNRERDEKWYADPAPSPLLTSRRICHLLTDRTTLSATELQMGLEMMSDRLPDYLAQGFSVQLGRLGTLRLEFGSEGVDEPEDFHYHLIRKPRIVFRPSRELTEQTIRRVNYNLEGLVVNGLAFKSVADYRRWQQMQAESEE